MHPFIKATGIVLMLSMGLNNQAFSQGRIWFSELSFDIKKEQKVQYTGGESSKSPAYGFSVNINNGGGRVAIGLQLDYSPVNLGDVTTPNVKKNSLKLWEFYAGLRYYPLLPTMRLGRSGAIRFTAGGMIGGYDFYWRETDSYDGNTLKWSPVQFSSLVFAGLCFSSFRSATGISAKLNYKPQTFSMSNFSLADFTLKQPFSLSLGLLIGPKIKH